MTEHWGPLIVFLATYLLLVFCASGSTNRDQPEWSRTESRPRRTGSLLGHRLRPQFKMAVLLMRQVPESMTCTYQPEMRQE